MKYMEILGIPRITIRNWLARGKRPRDTYSETIGRFSKWIEKNHPYNDEYYKIFYDPTKWPYIAYLYGVIITDGTIFYNITYKRYAIRIMGEKIFLERVNNMIYKLLGRRYSIFKDKLGNRFIIEITRKTLCQIMKLGLQSIEPLMNIIGYNETTKKGFILGIVDGDGTYTPTDNYVIIKKTKRWWIVSYSGYLLKTLGVRYRWMVNRNGGRIRIIKNRYKVVEKDRFRWYSKGKVFITKIGPTI